MNLSEPKKVKRQEYMQQIMNKFFEPETMIKCDISEEDLQFFILARHYKDGVIKWSTHYFPLILV